MADIGGISGFNPATVRSSFDAEASAQRRAEERQRQEELQEERRVEGDVQAQESDTEQEAAAQRSQEAQQDTVALSSAAQDFLVQARDDATAANDDAIASVQQADVAARTQVGGVNGTNQDTADEENTTTVNGNRDQDSEQTRALGQIVDQFA